MNDSQKDILEAAKMDLQKYIVLNDFKQVESYMGFFKKYNKPEGLNYSIKSIFVFICFVLFKLPEIWFCKCFFINLYIHIRINLNIL